METISKIKGFKIVDIFVVELDNILLELYFIISHTEKKRSFRMSIDNDGESVLFYDYENWEIISSIEHEVFKIRKINSDETELNRLINSNILSIQFGIEKSNSESKHSIYYIKMTTNSCNFLFFNNGDNGHYATDQIDRIVKADIFDFYWSNRPC